MTISSFLTYVFLFFFLCYLKLVSWKPVCNHCTTSSSGDLDTGDPDLDLLTTACLLSSRPVVEPPWSEPTRGPSPTSGCLSLSCVVLTLRLVRIFLLIHLLHSSVNNSKHFYCVCLFLNAGKTQTCFLFWTPSLFCLWGNRWISPLVPTKSCFEFLGTQSVQLFPFKSETTHMWPLTSDVDFVPGKPKAVLFRVWWWVAPLESKGVLKGILSL